MTAEIAILNRNCVALAADSAVTITHGNSIKIYQSQNKLFCLSPDPPIGLLIYNNLDWLGTPWELVLGDFTEHLKTIAREERSLEFVIGEFLAFLGGYIKNESRHSADFEGRLILLIERVNRDFGDAVARDPNFNPRRLLAPLDKVIEAIASEYRAYPLRSDFTSAEIDACIDRLGGTIRRIVEDRFEPVAFTFAHDPEDIVHRIKNLLRAVLASGIPSEFHTGLVFAGFAPEPGLRFPRLVHGVADGLCGDKVKFVVVERYEVDDGDRGGTVLPFAQSETAERFLYGSDDIYDRGVADYFATIIAQAPRALAALGLRLGKRHRSHLEKSMAEFARRVSTDFLETGRFAIRRPVLDEVRDLVQAMPKREVAEFAESLVAMTAVRRKMSLQSETVGGPVDVAVMSRHEGFVWVKRKHYFPLDLNPRYAEKLRTT